MARGWESKAVEDQVSEHAAHVRADEQVALATAAEREQAERLRSVRLSRSRVANQLAAATNPAHRHTLTRALDALDEQIAQLSQAPTD